MDMTVDELEDFIKYYKEHNSGNDEVVVCDDGMRSTFLSVDFACGTSISKTIKPAVIDYDNGIPYQKEPPVFETFPVLMLRTDIYCNEVK